MLASSWPARASAATSIYFTHFEAVEGFSTNLDLAGQEDWVSYGSGGNGVVADFFAGFGQQAYIGYSAPDSGDQFLGVWQPLDLAPVPTNTPLITFSVLMAVMDSANGNYDDFYWSVYNVQGDPMFTIDFDNYNTNIWYALGTNFFFTGTAFVRDTIYTLAITMDFARNRWSAALDGEILAADQPIAGVGVPLNLGDIDAVWAVYSTSAPGDNYMLFDDYEVTAEAVTARPASLTTPGRDADGWFPLRLAGQSGNRYAIEASTNLIQWTPLRTNLVTRGYSDFVDSTATGFAKRFYRARQVP